MWAIMEKPDYNKMNLYFWLSITIFKQNVRQKVFKWIFSKSGFQRTGWKQTLVS